MLGGLKQEINEIIMNKKTNYLYSNEFEEGRFFSVVFEDDTSKRIKIAPRTNMQVTYIKEKDDIEGIKLTKLINGEINGEINFHKFNIAQLKCFLKLISEIDLKGISEKKIRISDDIEGDEKSIKTFLKTEHGKGIIETVLKEGVITSKDIVNTAFRKRGLEIFKKLLKNKEYYKEYAKENNINDHSEEKTWQYFFKKNEWIFGYGLDYQYKSILQDEAMISPSSIGKKNCVITDYLMGDKQFTTFVELKTPTTILFKKKQNRSNAWCLSNELFDSVSQILEQKASGDRFIDKENYDSKGEKIKQKAYDSKVILIIGNWSEIENSNDSEKEIKKKTFELFRRDSRNIEIITFDELYDRAVFIVNEFD